MAEKSYRDLAPFGGITRIRFKGFVQDVSAVSAPPLFEESKKEEGRSKREILPYSLLLNSFFLYLASVFAFVWKMASQAPFSIFQTVPQL